MNPPRSRKVNLYLGPAHACSYLPDRQARAVFADPRAPVEPVLYSRLIEQGFRRSGPQLYRPECAPCAACRSLRIPVAAFRERRRQRRIRKRNADLRMHWTPPEFRDEHYALYRRYQTDRHAGGGMDDDDPAAYRAFLTGDVCATRFAEFRCGERLLAVAVVDRIDHGLSAVYTFYDAREFQRSLGGYAILRLIDHARALGLAYLYLGYWIENSPKMAYKAGFLPHELFVDGAWRPIGT